MPKIDLPVNSYASRSNQNNDHPAAITKGTKITPENAPKEGFGKKLIDQFIAMKPKDVGRNLWKDVLVPGIINLASDTIGGAKNLFLFGSGAAPNSSPTPPPLGTPYSAISTGTVQGPAQPQQTARKATYNFTNVYIRTKDEATKTLSSMLVRLKQYGEVTLSYFYYIVDVEQEYPSDSWGWRNLDNVEIKQTPYGFLLTLPDVVKLND